MKNGIGSYKTKKGLRFWFKVKIGHHVVVRGGFLKAYDAKIARSDVISRYRGESLRDCPTFNVLCDVYSERHLKEVKLSTAYQFMGIVKNYFKGHIPNKRIDLINYLDFSDWWEWVKSQPIKKKNYLLRILWNMFDFASVEYFYFGKEYKRLIPYKDYSIKDPIGVQTKAKVLSVEQMVSFMKAVKDEKFKLMFLLAFVTGMRISEVRGLIGRAFDGRKLYVFQQVSKFGKKALVNSGIVPKNKASVIPDKPIFVSPKSRNSNRFYVLPKSLSFALNSWISKYAIKDDDFIFFSQSGDKGFPVAERTVNRKLDDAIKESGVPRITFHKFRHSDATLLHDMGLDDTSIAMYLGHKSADVTREFYIHQTDKKEEDISNDLDVIAKEIVDK